MPQRNAQRATEINAPGGLATVNSSLYCKTRYFCPGCHQKRTLAAGEWLEENVLAPVPHRQYVFSLPRLIRPFFGHRRRYLGELRRLVPALLKAGFKGMAPPATLTPAGPDPPLPGGWTITLSCLPLPDIA